MRQRIHRTSSSDGTAGNSRHGAICSTHTPKHSTFPFFVPASATMKTARAPISAVQLARVRRIVADTAAEAQIEIVRRLVQACFSNQQAPTVKSGQRELTVLDARCC